MDRIESLRIDIEGHIEDAHQIRKELWHIGPGLITKMRDRGGFGMTSLRQIARESGLSPTYLSQCANGRAILSPAAFVTLATMLKEQDQPCSKDNPKQATLDDLLGAIFDAEKQSGNGFDTLASAAWDNVLEYARSIAVCNTNMKPGEQEPPCSK